MSAPLPDSPSISSSGYTDGLGRRELSFDRETGALLERLHVRPEIGVFDAAITARVDQLQSLTDERFARPLAVEREAGRIIIVSEYVSGVRVSELLETPDALQDAPTLDLALAFLLEALPALGAFHAATGSPHGLISAGRTVLASSPRVVFLDAAFGDVIGRLHYSRLRLWREYGLAMPPSAGPSRFTVASDIAQIALTALMLVLGRPIRDDEYPNGLAALVSEVSDVAMIRGSEAFAVGLQQFLHTALSVTSKLSYRAAQDAASDVRQIAELEMGTDACQRALTAFIEQIDVGAQPLPSAALESALAGVGFDDEIALEDTPDADSVLLDTSVPIEQEITLDTDDTPATYDLTLSPDTDTSFDTIVADTETFALPKLDEAADSFTSEPARSEELYADHSPTLDPEPAFLDSTFDKPIETYEPPSAPPEPEPEPEPVATFEERATTFESSEIGSSEAEPVSTFEPPAAAFEAPAVRRSETEAPFVAEPDEAVPARLETAEPEPPEAELEPEPARSSFFSPRRKKEDKSKSARARKDRLRSAAAALKESVMSRVTSSEARAPEAARPAEIARAAAPVRIPEPTRAPEPARAPEPSPPPVLPPPLPKPAPSLIPAHRAAAFDPPVPEPPAAPRPFTQVTPIVPPAPAQPAAVAPPSPFAQTPPFAQPTPPSPPMPVFNAQPISLAPPSPPPIQLQGSSPISLAPPSSPSIPLSPSTPALKLKSAPVNLATPPKRPRSEPPPHDEMPPFRPKREADTPRQFPWKLAVAGLVLIVGGAIGGRFYLMKDRKVQEDRVAAEQAAIAERAKLPPPKRGAAGVASGKVVIDTQPPGAKVLMDGLAVGQTPLTLDSVTAGKHVVTLISDSGSIKRTIKVDAGQTVTLNEQIFGGWVAIFAPITFDVAEKGRAIGNTEEGRLMLSPGRHELTLTNKALGYSGVHAVDIEPGEVRSLTIEPKGTANFNAVPWAEVWVNDQKIGETPIANKELPLGVHNVVFKNPQYGERKVTATVKANEPVALSVDFNR